jgi:hypothetical protein
MKKVIIVFFMIISYNSFCQLDNLVGKLDGHIGYSLIFPKDLLYKGGFSVSIEPKVWYNDELVVGAKLGVNLLQTDVEGIRIAPLTNVALVGEYYMPDNGFEYFFGASAGANIGGHIKPTDARAPTVLGLAPRAGIQFGQYRLLAEYHLGRQRPKFLSIMVGYYFGAE